MYAPNFESLKWPDSFDSLKFINHARQRRWVRNRKQISDHMKQEISLGLLKPGDTMPLPLSGLTRSRQYVLQLRPSNISSCSEYSWSSAVDELDRRQDSVRPKGYSAICVSKLAESQELLYCNQTSGTSSDGNPRLWFCVSIQATEISKDIHCDPIHDWLIVVKAPLSITNYLPLGAEYSILEMKSSGHFVTCSRGILSTGETEKIYNVDIRNPLFLSLFPQGGWMPKHVR